MTPWLAAAPAAAVAVGGGLWLYARRRRPAPTVTPEAAAAAAERALPGFVAANALVATDWASALVVGGGRVALVVPRGRRLMAREVAWPAVRVVPGALEVDGADWRMGRVRVAGITAIEVRRLLREP